MPPSCSCCWPIVTTWSSPTRWPQRSGIPSYSKTPPGRWSLIRATHDGDQVLQEWERHSRIDHDAVAADRNGNANDAHNCTSKAVVLRGERWGWLHVLHGGDPVVGIAGYALDRAADGIAIALLGARESGARSAQRQNALVNRLLLGDISGEAFVARALRIGRDLRDRALVVVFVCKDGPPTHSGEDAIEELCRSLHVPAVVADLGEQTLVIMGLSHTSSEKQVVERLTALDVRAGISRPVSANQLPTAVEQARSAASVAMARPERAVHRFDDLGVLRLLASLAGGPELARYIEDELGSPAQTRRHGHQPAPADVAHLPVLRRQQVAGRAVALRAAANPVLPAGAHRESAGTLAGRSRHPSGADLRRPRT